MVPKLPFAVLRYKYCFTYLLQISLWILSSRWWTWLEGRSHFHRLIFAIWITATVTVFWLRLRSATCFQFFSFRLLCGVGLRLILYFVCVPLHMNRQSSLLMSSHIQIWLNFITTGLFHFIRAFEQDLFNQFNLIYCHKIVFVNDHFHISQ